MGEIRKWLTARKTDKKSVVFLLIKGYFFLTLLCFIILLLPISQNKENTVIDHLFFSVSIVSTTGLAPANFVESYNAFGQVISLLFIQLGGIGYMALSSFIVLRGFDKLPSISARLLKLEFNLPEKYPLTLFIYSVFIFTIFIETIGVIFLYYGFSKAGVENALWSSIFHSISAFCTAGFSLFDNSLSSFKHVPIVTYTIQVLALLGSIGFIVLLDFWLKITGRRASITLTSKIILIGTFLIWIASSLIIFLSDTNLSSMGYQGLEVAIFQSISAHTTVGFNNYDIGNINNVSIFVMIILMVIGASPAGTGGGIKTTSMTALIAVLVSVLKQRKRITFLDKEIPTSNIYSAVSSTFFYIFILIIGIYLVLFFDGDNFKLEQLFFEVSSALSTVGLSTGITSQLTDQSKIIISILMFIGRLGVLTIGFALISRSPYRKQKLKTEEIAI